MYLLSNNVLSQYWIDYGYYAGLVCSELHGQIPEDDPADISTFSGVSDAANRHVNFSKAGSWWRYRLIIFNCILNRYVFCLIWHDSFCSDSFNVDCLMYVSACQYSYRMSL